MTDYFGDMDEEDDLLPENAEDTRGIPDDRGFHTRLWLLRRFGKLGENE